MEQSNEKPARSARGFALMDPSRRREISSKGGRAAHEKGTAHQFSPDEARDAGRKGGQAVSVDRDHMAQIGRAGGRARRKVRPEEEASPVSTTEPRAAAEKPASAA